MPDYYEPSWSNPQGLAAEPYREYNKNRRRRSFDPELHEFAPQGGNVGLIPTQYPYPGIGNSNPWMQGIQLGMYGSMMGLGVGAIQQGISKMRGIQGGPSNMWTPMLIGALIGAGLGTAGGFKSRGAQMNKATLGKSWGEISDQWPTKFGSAGMEKQAIAPLVALLWALGIAGGYFGSQQSAKSFGTAAGMKDRDGNIVPGMEDLYKKHRNAGYGHGAMGILDVATAGTASKATLPLKLIRGAQGAGHVAVMSTDPRWNSRYGKIQPTPVPTVDQINAQKQSLEAIKRQVMEYQNQGISKDLLKNFTRGAKSPLSTVGSMFKGVSMPDTSNFMRGVKNPLGTAKGISSNLISAFKGKR